MLRAVDRWVERLVVDPDAAQPVLAEAFGYLLDYHHGYHHPREDRLFERSAPSARRWPKPWQSCPPNIRPVNRKPPVWPETWPRPRPRS